MPFNPYCHIADEFSQTREFAWKEFDKLFQDLPPLARVLDVGCGNGRLFPYLVEKKNISSYVGIDITQKFIDIASSEYSNSFAVFEHRGFLDITEKNAYDAIACIASFHHLFSWKDRLQALQNCFDALVENGQLMLTVWNWRNQKKYENNAKQAIFRAEWNPFYTKKDGIIPFGKEKIPRYYYGFDTAELINLLEQVGFINPYVFFSENEKNICVVATKKLPIQKRFWVQNVPFHITSASEVLKTLVLWADQKGLQKKVYTPNPEMIVEAHKNHQFLQVLQNAHLSLADGNGVLWASGLQKTLQKGLLWRWIEGIFTIFFYFLFRTYYPSPLKKTICGSDIFASFLEQKKGKIFLLGGMPNSAVSLAKKYDNIVGYDDGMVNAERIPEILKKINDSHANVLFVALGAPKQEMFIDKHIAHLPNVSFAMGVGGSFDFLVGNQTRAPQIVRTIGLEWLYRLYKQPERANRIWNATGRFIALILHAR